MHSILSLSEVIPRLDWEPEASEFARIEGALQDATNLVRHYGDPEWSSATAPAMVKTIVFQAAVRYLGNPDGFTSSRAGDEMVQWEDHGDGAGTVFLTPTQVRIIENLVNPQLDGLVSVPIYAWSSGGVQGGRPPGYVPVQGGGWYPLFSSDEHPW